MSNPICKALPAPGCAAAASMFTLAALLAATPARAVDDSGAGDAANSLIGRVSAAVPQTGGTVSTERTAALVPTDVAGEPTARPAGTVERITVSRWAHAGRASVGMGFGTVGVREAGSSALQHPTPALTVGVRLAVAERAMMYADASGASGWEAPRYNTRVGMEFKSASNSRGLGFDRGAIGFQLDSGYRLQMRPRKGGLAIYLRGQF